MKISWLAILLTLLLQCSFANEQLYAWAHEQYKANDTYIIESTSTGNIDARDYLAIIAKKPDEMLFVVYDNTTNNKPTNVAMAHLPESPPWAYNVEIKKNSIFLTSGYCHHGCYDYRYQFKRIDNVFRLIGAESQFETVSIYFDEKNVKASCGVQPDEDIPDSCGVDGVSSGNSYNLLNSTSICWLDKTGKTRANHTFRPRGVQHKVISEMTDLPLMDGFNPENTNLPKTCYFDYNKKWHLSEVSPNE